MNINLVVVKPFGGFTAGDVIADETRIAQILRSEHVRSVVRVVVTPDKGE